MPVLESVAKTQLAALQFPPNRDQYSYALQYYYLINFPSNYQQSKLPSSRIDYLFLVVLGLPSAGIPYTSMVHLYII